MKKQSISRRDFIRNSSWAGLTGLELSTPSVGHVTIAESETRRDKSMSATRPGLWPVPACAWKRPLGNLPKIELMPELPHEFNGLNTLQRAKKGIPLGGMGAGNFMYNLCGTFGPWQLKVGRYEERFLPQAAFHFREQV